MGSSDEIRPNDVWADTLYPEVAGMRTITCEKEVFSTMSLHAPEEAAVTSIAPF